MIDIFINLAVLIVTVEDGIEGKSSKSRDHNW